VKLAPATVVRLHELKIWPRFFREVALDRKHVEVRRYDRDFLENDVLLLREWDPESKKYSGRIALRRVTGLTRLAGELLGWVALEVARLDPEVP
jgi:hypothetical protein